MITLYDIFNILVCSLCGRDLKPLLAFLLAKAQGVARNFALCYEAGTKLLCAGCIGIVNSHPGLPLGGLERDL